MKAEYIFQIILVLAGAILIAKSIHFYTSINRKKIRYWFYFDRMNIANSKNQNSRVAKNLQNTLSILLAALLFGALLVSLLDKP